MPVLSRKAKYALKALIYLGNYCDRDAVLISEIADEERIPKKFLEQILLALKNRGILRSRKGKGGGYSLGPRPEEISIGEVIRMFDGPFAPVPCVSETAYTRCTECLDEKGCAIRLLMKDVRDAVAEILLGTTLADMLRRRPPIKRRGSNEHR